MSTQRTQSSMQDLIEMSRRKRAESSAPSIGGGRTHPQVDPAQLQRASQQLLEHAEKMEKAKSTDRISQVIAKINPMNWKSRGIFWLSQVGAFAEAMVKGKYNKAMAIRAYEMVQSIQTN